MTRNLQDNPADFKAQIPAALIDEETGREVSVSRFIDCLIGLSASDRINAILAVEYLGGITPEEALHRIRQAQR